MARERRDIQMVLEKIRQEQGPIDKNEEEEHVEMK